MLKSLLKASFLLQLKVKMFISAFNMSPSLPQVFPNLVDLGPQKYSCLFYMARASAFNVVYSQQVPGTNKLLRMNSDASSLRRRQD